MFGVTLVLSGCGCTEWASKKAGEKIMEKAIESGTGGNVDVDTSKETMTVKTDQGSMTAGKGAKVPDNFPKDIFMYSDALISFSMSGTSGENSYSVVYNTAATPEEAFLKYKEEMAKNSWKKDSELDMGEQGKMINFKKENASVSVSMGLNQDSENVGKTTITVTGGEEKISSPSGESNLE